MITHEMKAALRKRGFSDDAIKLMRPGRGCRKILTSPRPAEAPRKRSRIKRPRIKGIDTTPGTKGLKK